VRACVRACLCVQQPCQHAACADHALQRTPHTAPPPPHTHPNTLAAPRAAHRV
jgi:hypothetical protein